MRSVARTGAKETDMYDWKLSPLPIITLRGWGYREQQHRRGISKTARPWRSVVRSGVAIIGRLLATS
jgi:hypothetical protein